MRVTGHSPGPGHQGAPASAAFSTLIDRCRARLAAEAVTVASPSPLETRCRVAALVDACLGDAGCAPGTERDGLLRALVDDLVGAGPLESLLADHDITEVMVNGPDEVYVECRGVLHRAPITFRDAEHVRMVVERLLVGTGSRIDQSSPMLDARLPDGSRLNAVLPPVAVGSAQLTIRRPAWTRRRIGDLIDAGSCDGHMAAFLHAAVLGRCNVVVSGGSGSGKTTLLGALCDLIPHDQRVVVLEDVAELTTDHAHVVRQETRPPGPERDDEIALRDLVRNALRMRPDRLVIGEVRGVEAADMVRAMNTGHEGSMTTLHANTAADALKRLESMLTLAMPAQPVDVLGGWVGSAIDLVVHCERALDGHRWVSTIAAIDSSPEGGVLEAVPVYRLAPPEGSTALAVSVCGEVPRRCLERMARHGVRFPPALFARSVAA